MASKKIPQIPPPEKKSPEKKFRPSFEKYQTRSFYSQLCLSTDAKAKTKFIQTIESVVRKSPEYASFIKYCKTEAENNFCIIFNTLPSDINNKLKIEMHHFPLTLYDIVETVLNKYLMQNLPFTRISIANEVMEAHFALKIGIVPLSVSMHQLAHSGSLIIDVKNVFGNYEEFVDEYRVFMSDEAVARFSMAKTKSSQGDFMREFNRDTLELNPLLFDEKADTIFKLGNSTPTTFEEIEDGADIEF